MKLGGCRFLPGNLFDVYLQMPTDAWLGCGEYASLGKVWAASSLAQGTKA